MRAVRLAAASAFALLLLPGLLAGSSLPASPGGATAAEIGPNWVLPHQFHTNALSCSSGALCPSQLWKAYNFSGLVNASATNGTGQTIVIVDACGDKSIAADLVTFDTATGLPAPPSLTVTGYGTGPTCTAGGWSLETSLDVEWAHAMAPGADLQLIVAAKPNNTDMFGAWGYALSNSLGAQISNSWGGHMGCSKLITGLLSTARTDHVTILASSGDGAAWGTGTTAKAQDPADCAQVLAVGGTTLTLSGSGGYGSESAWDGSGGGYVPKIAEPTFQSAAKISDPYTLLGKPDVAAVADPNTGVWVYSSAYSGWVVVGGTSVACPLWAGFIADANGLRASHTYPLLGAFNPYLYAHVYGVSGGSANYSKEVHDVTSGNNGWSAGTGWDAATGIGSFNAGALASQLGNDKKA